MLATMIFSPTNDELLDFPFEKIVNELNGNMIDFSFHIFFLFFFRNNFDQLERLNSIR